MSNQGTLTVVGPQLEELIEIARVKLGLTEEVIRRTLGSPKNGEVFRSQLEKLQVASLVAQQKTEEETKKIEKAELARQGIEEADAIKQAQALLNALNPPKPQPKLVPPPPEPLDPAKLKERLGLPVNYPSQILTDKGWALAMQWLLNDNLRAVERALRNATDQTPLNEVKSDIKRNLGTLKMVTDRHGARIERTNHTVRNEVEQWMMKDPVLAALITVPTAPKPTKPLNEAEQKKAEQKASQHAKKVERLTEALVSEGFDQAATDRIVKNCFKKHNGDLLQAALGKRENSDLVRTAGTKLNDAAVIAKADEELHVAYRYANAISIARAEFDGMYTARLQRKLTERLVANAIPTPTEQHNKPLSEKQKRKLATKNNKK